MFDEQQQKDSMNAFRKVVAKTWSDPAFKARLTADPKSVLAEHGVSVPEGVDLKVVENSDKVVHLTLPAKPSGDLSDEQLDEVAGGWIGSVCGNACCACR